MSGILLIFEEEALSAFYEDELREFGLNAISVNTIEKAISILYSQQFDLIVLNPDVWDKRKLEQLLDKMKLVKSTRRNTKILIITSFSSTTPDTFGFADALVVLGLGPEWLLAVCNLIDMDKQKVWDYYENKVKFMSGEHVRINRKHVTVFVCYAIEDFEQAHPIYKRLSVSYSPWMDKENIVGGQDWDLEITRTIEESKFFLACLSSHSVNKEGYVQKELKKGLEILDRQPEGSIYLIPVRLDNCSVPQRFRGLHWIDLFEANGMEKLLNAIETGCRQRGMV